MKTIFKVLYILLVSFVIATYDLQLKFVLALQAEQHSYLLMRIVGLSVGIVEPLLLIYIGYKLFKKH